jgi:hypothetical protein
VFAWICCALFATGLLAKMSGKLDPSITNTLGVGLVFLCLSYAASFKALRDSVAAHYSRKLHLILLGGILVFLSIALIATGSIFAKDLYHMLSAVFIGLPVTALTIWLILRAPRAVSADEKGKRARNWLFALVGLGFFVRFISHMRTTGQPEQLWVTGLFATLIVLLVWSSRQVFSKYKAPEDSDAVSS